MFRKGASASPTRNLSWGWHFWVSMSLRSVVSTLELCYKTGSCERVSGIGKQRLRVDRVYMMYLCRFFQVLVPPIMWFHGTNKILRDMDPD